MFAARCQVGCLRFALRRTSIVIRMAGFGLPVQIAVTVQSTEQHGAARAVFVLFYDVFVIGHVYTSCVKGREMPRARTICLHTHTHVQFLIGPRVLRV